MNTDDRVDQLNQLKTFPYKKVSLYDFGLDKVDWTNPTDDDLEQLWLYKHDLSWENLINTLTTGERIPAAVWVVERFEHEFPTMSYEEMYHLSYKGMEISDARRRASMTPEELQELDSVVNSVEIEMDEMFAEVVNAFIEESNLIKELEEQLFSDYPNA